MSSFGFSEYFRPCIDLHEGKVKQIVGSTLATDLATEGVNKKKGCSELKENYVALEDAVYFANHYAQYQLTGGHIIMLDQDERTVASAQEVIRKYPNDYQVGGGIDILKGKEWLSRGAGKVIVSSFLFENGKFQEERLERVAREFGISKLVVDLSSVVVDGNYQVAIHGWKTITDLTLSPKALEKIGSYCGEILIHAIAHEGMRGGLDKKLFDFLEKTCTVPWVYAGGIESLNEVKMICNRSQQVCGRVGFTVGSSLDVFGGNLSLKEILEITRLYAYI